MSYVTVFYIIMLVVFVSYVSFIWAKYGVQKSISQSYYVLPENLRFLMTLFCWGFSIPAIIIGSTGLMFLAGSGICFVGAAAAFQEKLTREVHMIGAAVGVIASQLAIFLNFGLWPLNIVFIGITSLLFLFRKKIFKNYVWWIEILAFVLICITLSTLL